MERRALYFPNDKVYGEVPEEVEVVTFKTQDNLELQAWYLPPAKGQYLLVYFHGNGGNLSGLGRLFKILKEGGFGVLAVDYRGYGKSEGDPSEQGLYLDGLAAYDYALGKVKPERLVLHGRSLGGGVASYVAQNRHCAALVLESTFTSTHEVAKGSHGAKAAMFIEAFDNLSRMKSLKMPVFIIHGDADNLIPPQMSKQLHEACPNSTLWLVEGATHNNLLRTAGNKVYTQKIKEFLEGAEGNNL